MTQKTASDIPNAAWILALVGGILIVLSGALLLGVGAFVLPHVDYANVAVPSGFDAAGIPALVSGTVGTMGAIGLVSGAIVMVAAVMLLRGTSSRKVWSALILAFSILSFVGLGGFVLGAVLGMIGGILALRYRPSVQSI